MPPITTPAPILATALALLLVACTFDRASLRAARDGQANDPIEARADAVDAETDGSIDAPIDLGPADLPPDGPLPAAFGCPADPTLVACFAFDEAVGTAVKDGSSFMNNGLTDAKWVAGVSGSALEFDDGAKKVTAASAPSLNLPGPDATFEAWVKPMTFPTDSNVDFVIAKRALDASFSGFLFGVYKGGIYLCNAGSACCSAGVLPVGAWTHIAAVSDATGRRLYQDGAQVGVVGGSCPTPLAGTSNSAPLTIGNASAPAANLGFRGAIDVVRVYARAKSPAEICADANRTWTGSTCGVGSDGGAADGPPDAPSGAGTCASPFIVPPPGGRFAGTTSGASLLKGSTCGGGDGPEAVFRWTPAATGMATVSLCATTTKWDSVLYMKSGSCAGPAVACDDDACCTGGVGSICTSHFKAAVTGGMTYFIVVDGYAASNAGAYVLDVTPSP